MKRIFVSFADTRYIKSLERIKSETELFGFDERYFLTEKDLPKDFFRILIQRFIDEVMVIGHGNHTL